MSTSANIDFWMLDGEVIDLGSDVDRQAGALTTTSHERLTPEGAGEPPGEQQVWGGRPFQDLNSSRGGLVRTPTSERSFSVLGAAQDFLAGHHPCSSRSLRGYWRTPQPFPHSAPPATLVSPADTRPARTRRSTAPSCANGSRKARKYHAPSQPSQPLEPPATRRPRANGSASAADGSSPITFRGTGWNSTHGAYVGQNAYTDAIHDEPSPRVACSAGPPRPAGLRGDRKVNLIR